MIMGPPFDRVAGFLLMSQQGAGTFDRDVRGLSPVKKKPLSQPLRGLTDSRRVFMRIHLRQSGESWPAERAHTD